MAEAYVTGEDFGQDSVCSNIGKCAIGHEGGFICVLLPKLKGIFVWPCSRQPVLPVGGIQMLNMAHELSKRRAIPRPF
jgi:hypothetical protein